ncbi:MAG: NAD(P)-dependent glycerol-1-phosphate dehydrogenase [Thermoplasmata archaeon]|nr:MAG: NAD(P)-dependent glycerol-1-phosphate dehydrogenase [Thermoplasmata archaeon]
MVKRRTMSFPRKVVIGHGVLEDLPSVVLELTGAEKVLVVTGPRTYEAAGGRVRELLSSEGVEVEIVFPDAPTIGEAERVSRMEGDVILGVGGGSKIDVAKLAAKLSNRPFISVPTSASHDGVASPMASLRGAGKKHSVPAAPPLAIVADTSVIVRAPYRYMASGAADLISNLTALMDWELSHRLTGEEISHSAYALSNMAANLVVEHASDIKPNLEESAWLVMKSLIMSGVSMSVAGSSRPASGAEHMFAHALEELAPGRGLHGELCGLGTIIMAYLHGADWEGIRDALATIGAPTRASQLGIPDEKVVEALLLAPRIRPERFTILGVGGLKKEAAVAAARKTGVI